MERRTFLTATAGLALSSLEAALPATIIDTHTHFWDTARPQGVTYPPPTDSLLYRAYTINPFLYRSLDQVLTHRILEAEIRNENPSIDEAEANMIVLRRLQGSRTSHR